MKVRPFFFQSSKIIYSFQLFSGVCHICIICLEQLVSPKTLITLYLILVCMCDVNDIVRKMAAVDFSISDFYLNKLQKNKFLSQAYEVYKARADL